MLFNVLLLKVVANYQPLGLAVKSGMVTGERNERNAENGNWNAEKYGHSGWKCGESGCRNAGNRGENAENLGGLREI